MYLVYKTINLINLHYYIGVHKQKASNFDSYLGSGTGLKRAIKKYGKEYFVRIILYSFDNCEDAYNKEIQLLEHVYKSTSCYNMHPGGRGIRGNICTHSLEWRNKVSNAHKGKKLSPERRKQISIRQTGNNNVSKRQEVRLKISNSKRKPNFKLRGKASGNSIKVSTPEGIFDSFNRAAKHYNISGPTVKAWIVNNKNGFVLL